MPASPLGKSDRDCDGMTVFSYLLLLLLSFAWFSQFAACCNLKGLGVLWMGKILVLQEL